MTFMTVSELLAKRKATFALEEARLKQLDYWLRARIDDALVSCSIQASEKLPESVNFNNSDMVEFSGLEEVYPESHWYEALVEDLKDSGWRILTFKFEDTHIDFDITPL